MGFGTQKLAVVEESLKVNDLNIEIGKSEKPRKFSTSDDNIPL